MNAETNGRPLALVTGASSGIGLELACECARHGFDLILAADRPLDDAVFRVERLGAKVQTVQEDLATLQGVDALYGAAGGRSIEVLMANAGHGLGKGFFDQEFEAARHVVETNVTGTIYLIHRIATDMRARGRGRILVTGSIAGLMPGTFQAVYNGTKAFIDSFSWALRNELKHSGVQVTCLMPGVTDTEFFERADLMDTEVGATEKKMDPRKVAQIGFRAMMDGEGDVVAGLKNRLQAAVAHLTPSAVLAEQHRKIAQPRSAQH